MATQREIDELERRARDFDWRGDMNSDPSYRERNREERERIKDAVQQVGDEGRKIYEHYNPDYVDGSK